MPGTPNVQRFYFPGFPSHIKGVNDEDERAGHITVQLLQFTLHVMSTGQPDSEEARKADISKRLKKFKVSQEQLEVITEVCLMAECEPTTPLALNAVFMFCVGYIFPDESIAISTIWPLVQLFTSKCMAMSMKFPPVDHSVSNYASALQDLSLKSTEDHLCNSCGKLTTKSCSRCASDELGAAAKVWYCSVACQQMDWISHKTSCQQAHRRRTLERAVALLSIAWNHFISNIKETQVSKVFRKHGIVFVEAQRLNYKGFTGGFMFESLADAKFFKSEEERRGFADMNNHDDVPMYFGDLIEYLIRRKSRSVVYHWRHNRTNISV
jgi:hypothetical protein